MIQFLWPLSVALLLAVAALWHRHQRKLGRPYPFSTFLYNPINKYTDLTMTITCARRPQPYAPVGFMQHGQDNIFEAAPSYFPLTMWFLRLGPVGWLRLFYCAIVAGLTFAWGWPAAVAMLLSYPAMFSDDRGNLDHVVTGWSALAIAALLSGHPYIGALMLSVPAAMKGYSAAFGLLWIGHPWALLVLAASTLVLFFGPSMLFSGGIRPTMAALKRGNEHFLRTGILASNGPAFSTSHYCADVFSAIRLLHWWRGKDFDSLRWFRPYLAASTPWALGLAWIAWTSQDMWVTLLALGLIQVIWPHVANDYKLTALVPGIVFWIRAGCPSWVVFACLALLWAPKQYWHPRPYFTAASISCVINPVLTIVLTTALAHQVGVPYWAALAAMGSIAAAYVALVAASRPAVAVPKLTMQPEPAEPREISIPFEPPEPSAIEAVQKTWCPEAGHEPMQQLNRAQRRAQKRGKP